MHVVVYNRRLAIYMRQRSATGRIVIVKTGVHWRLLLDMDDWKYQQHMRLTRAQFNYILCVIDRGQQQAEQAGRWSGRPRLSVSCRTLLVLW